MEIVVNEWLLDYMRPDSEKLGFAFRFLDQIELKAHRLVIREESPFVRKLYRYDKQFFRYFKRLKMMLRDSDKVKLIDEQEIQPLPPKIAGVVPYKDTYLVELAYSTSDKLIVTTDTRLQEALKDIESIKIYLVDEFIEEFLT